MANRRGVSWQEHEFPGSQGTTNDERHQQRRTLEPLRSSIGALSKRRLDALRVARKRLTRERRRRPSRPARRRLPMVAVDADAHAAHGGENGATRRRLLDRVRGPPAAYRVLLHVACRPPRSRSSARGAPSIRRRCASCPLFIHRDVHLCRVLPRPARKRAARYRDFMGVGNALVLSALETDVAQTLLVGRTPSGI